MNTTADLTAQRKYTKTPDNFPDRVGAEALRVTAGATTPYDKALALQSYFQDPENFTYDLQPQLGTGTQALVNFLFKVHTGFCEQFAAAFGEMARSLGLPTRVAVGYETGTFTTRSSPRRSYTFDSSTRVITLRSPAGAPP